MTARKKISVTDHPIDHVPDDILAGIGAIIAWWGYLEFQLGVIVRVIMRLPKDSGRVLMPEMGLSTICRILNILTITDHWAKDKSIRTDLRHLTMQVKAKSQTRNRYAHGVYGYGTQPGDLIRFEMKRAEHRITPKEVPLTMRQLTIDADDARTLWGQAQGITERLKAQRRRRRT